MRALLAWADGTEPFEDRWIAAALDDPLPAAAGGGSAVAHARRLLRRTHAAGYTAPLGRVRVPRLLWAPTAPESRRLGIEAPRVRADAADHTALAVEAALRLAPTLCASGAIATLRADVGPRGLSAEVRRAHAARHRRAPARGDRLAPTADLEVMTAGGRQVRLEVLSSSYDDGEIRAKWAALGAGAIYVASSRTVARRAVAAGVPVCHHF